MSIKYRLLLSFIICITLTFGCVGIYLNSYIIPTSKNISFNNASLQVQSNAKDINIWLTQRINELRIINALPATKELNFNEVTPYINNLNELLRVEYGSDNESFAIGDTSGQGWINDQLYIDISKRKYFNELMNSDSEYYISVPLISKSDNKPIFIICYGITDLNNNKIGFINGAISLDYFNDILLSSSIYDGSPWIANSNKDIYSFENNDVDDDLMNYINECNDLSGHYVANNSTTFFHKIISSNDLIYAITINNDILYAESNQLIDLFINLCILLVIIVGIVLLVQSSWILRPIKKLDLQVREISLGNLDIRNNLKGKNEISKLGKVMNQMCVDIKKYIEKTNHAEKIAHDSELKALQMQINQHFLYNTLDTIQWKAINLKDLELSEIIFQLSQFFRITLSNGKTFITIEDEIKHVTSYLKIQSVRFNNEFTYSIDVDSEVLQKMIPKLIIQPLVENSMTHGFKFHQGNIIIKIGKDIDKIIISVEDDGIGIKSDKLEEIRDNLKNHYEASNYGLFNINEKLYITYGDVYELSINSIENKYTKIVIKIPWLEEFEC